MPIVAAASKAYAQDSNAHWGPTVDGVDVLASPHDQAQKGELHTGAVLLGTAKDETCSLEGREWSFELTEAQFDTDTLAEYGSIGINVSRVNTIYAGYHNQTQTRRRLFTSWWWGRGKLRNWP